MQLSLVKTADGSHSLYVKELDEHYHSIHGAIQESKHVFIETGLKYISSNNNSPINILEIGLGTGLNALLTFIESQKLNLKINYTAIESFPLEISLINELNYLEYLKEENQKDIFIFIHSCNWGKEIPLSTFFIIDKIRTTLQEINFNRKYDLIYFDAFGPRVQPEMWTEEIFSKLFLVLKPNSCLVTYCAKGEVKRTLKKVGFIVETLPGPPGKREMIRAIKKIKMEINKFNIRVYGILINSKKQVLVCDELIKEKQITKFPGGGLEFGEGTIDCIKREFWEETNNQIEIVEHFYTTDYFQISAYNSSHQIVSIYYLVKPITEFVIVSQEKINFRWLDLKLISENDFTLPIDKIVGEMLRKQKGNSSY